MPELPLSGAAAAGRGVLRETLLPLVGALLLFGLNQLSASADGQIVPASNSVLAASPKQIRLTGDGPLDPTTSTLTVYTANHQPLPGGQPRVLAAGDQSVLIEDLPELDPGVYTVVWHTVVQPTGAAANGSSTFLVDPSGSSPQVVAQPQPRFSLPTLDRSVPRALAFIGILSSVGCLLLRWWVWRPVLGRLDPTHTALVSLRAAIDRRLTLATAAALVLFVPATLIEFATQGASAAPTARTLWLIRLTFTAFAAIFGFTAGWRALRARSAASDARRDVLLGLTLACCALELLIRTLPGAFPADVPRQVFTSALDWSHLLGSSTWVGGLIGLAATVPLLRSDGLAPTGVSGTLIRRFSGVALICVGVMTASGLWTAWIHVGSPELLLTTLYGRTLAVKLGLVIVLIGLGAFNLLWLLPRIEAIQVADARGRSLLAVALSHFRRVIGLEVVVGVAILCIVPFLSGSARNQAAQTQATDLSQTASADGLPITFRPSALQPGLVEYDVSLGTADARRVALTFEAPDLGIPPVEAIAASRADRTFRVSGMYASVVGAWRVHVAVDPADGGARRMATFNLSIQADPLRPTPAPPPPIVMTTWLYGIVEVIAIASLLLIAQRLSHWATRRTDWWRRRSELESTDGSSAS